MISLHVDRWAPWRRSSRIDVLSRQHRTLGGAFVVCRVARSRRKPSFALPFSGRSQPRCIQHLSQKLLCCLCLIRPLGVIRPRIGSRRHQGVVVVTILSGLQNIWRRTQIIRRKAMRSARPSGADRVTSTCPRKGCHHEER